MLRPVFPIACLMSAAVYCPTSVVFPNYGGRLELQIRGPRCLEHAGRDQGDRSGQAPCRQSRVLRVVEVALDVKVILTPLYISLVIIYTKYTGWHQNDFNVHG